MAGQAEMEFTYSLVDKIIRLAIGPMGDFSGAMYDGHFEMSLEEAQHRKHAFIARQLNITAGSRVLDMGCGWGPMLDYLRGVGATGVGLTLSSAQAESCVRKGLDARVMDCRAVAPGDLGTFDAILSVGAFEHFCSFEEWQAGKQEVIYRAFFDTVRQLLPVGGRFYLQTMVFGRNMIRPEEIDIHAPQDSDAYAMAVMRRQFPGSWLPRDAAQVIEDARPGFTLVHQSCGRLDYIETIRQWDRRYRRFGIQKYLLYLSLVPRYLFDRSFRERVSGDQTRANIICFERVMLDHYRFVFEKAAPGARAGVNGEVERFDI